MQPIPTFTGLASLAVLLFLIIYLSVRDVSGPSELDRVTAMPSAIPLPTNWEPEVASPSAARVTAKTHSAIANDPQLPFGPDAIALWALLTDTEKQEILAGLDPGTPLTVLIRDGRLIRSSFVQVANLQLELDRGTLPLSDVAAIKITQLGRLDHP